MNRDGGAYNLPTTYDRIFWSRVYHQPHVTTCLMKFAVGRNVGIRYSFCVWLCNMNVVIENKYVGISSCWTEMYAGRVA